MCSTRGEASVLQGQVDEVSVPWPQPLVCVVTVVLQWYVAPSLLFAVFRSFQFLGP